MCTVHFGVESEGIRSLLYFCETVYCICDESFVDDIRIFTSLEFNFSVVTVNLRPAREYESTTISVGSNSNTREIPIWKDTFFPAIVAKELFWEKVLG
jgi:hypothetical protein